MSAIDSTMLSKNFSRAELACKCGCGLVPQQGLIDALQKLRDAIGPLTVTSGARCEKYNSQVGGEKASQHILGMAVDLAAPPGPLRYDILRTAIPLGFHGIGVGTTFLHIDIRPEATRAVWHYGTDGSAQ